MPPPTAHDVAREIRRHIPDAGRVKVQKLLYYCQGWHMAFRGAPMFDDSIEAWERGPVVPGVYRCDKYEVAPPPSVELDDARLNTIGWVVARYGSLRATDLVALTHAEDPWQEQWTCFGGGPIPQGAIEAYFASQVRAVQPRADLPVNDAVLGEDETPILLEMLAALAR